MKRWFLIVMLMPCLLKGQHLDSLKKELSITTNDSVRCRLLASIVQAEANDNIWPIYNNQLLQIAAKTIKEGNTGDYYFGHFADGLNNMGYLAKMKGDNDKALKFHVKSAAIMEQIGHFEALALALNNIGFAYYEKGDIGNALSYYTKALKLNEDLDSQGGIVIALNNIALVYRDQGEFAKALELYEQCVEISRTNKELQSEAIALNNIGFIYKGERKLELALSYFEKSWKILEKMENQWGVSISLTNIGSVRELQGNLDEALVNYGAALKLQKEMGAQKGICTSLDFIANVLLSKGEVISAGKKAESSLQIAQNLGYPENIRRAAATAKKSYQAQGRFMDALKMYKLEISMRDSLNNEATQKATIRQQTQYEFEKAQIVKENAAKEEARVLAEATSRRNNLQYSLIFLGILLLFGLVLSLGFIKVSPNIAEGLIFFAFLLLFEFVLVFVDPYLEEYTHGEPMYNLAANAAIALLIFPLHAVLERLLKKRIVK